jgi:hypothetical protein
MRYRDMVAMAYERLDRVAHPGAMWEPIIAQPHDLAVWRCLAGIGADTAETIAEPVARHFPGPLHTDPHDPQMVTAEAMRRLVRESRVERFANGWRPVLEAT